MWCDYGEFNKMKFSIEFTQDEINAKIPYDLIATIRYSSIWHKAKTKRTYNNLFSDVEREKAEKLFKQAHTWYIKGVSESVCMDLDVWNLWSKIINFCSMV